MPVNNNDENQNKQKNKATNKQKYPQNQTKKPPQQNKKQIPKTHHTHGIRYRDKGDGEGTQTCCHGFLITIKPGSKMEILEKVETYPNRRNSSNAKQG